MCSISMTKALGKEFILSALQNGDLNLQGQFLNASNYTFFTQLVYDSYKLAVVYKPVRGERPLWDFPSGSLAKREVAAYIVSEALGWGLVPPTIFRFQASFGPGSVQQFIEHDSEYHYFQFIDKDRQRLRPVAVFDFLVNNADRKGGHILMDQQNHIWLIDHGICFHVEDKLRTVVWDFVGEEIPEELRIDMQNLLIDLERKDRSFKRLEKLLLPEEIDALEKRAQFLLEDGHFPYPVETRFPYPWPPV